MWQPRRALLSCVLTLTVAVAGCTPAQKSGKGFTLPDGDAEVGKTAFTQLNCHQCHTVAGTDLPLVEDREMNIRLGGEVSRIGTYGELVTSIINPSHRLAKGHLTEEVSADGESLMRNYNEILTVQQLIDLTAFLQSRYILRKYEPTEYPMYYGM